MSTPRRRCLGDTLGRAAALAIVAVGVSAARADAVAPTRASAVVDGSAAEWTADDVVATLVSNDPPHATMGRLSLRYDCGREVLFALVAAVDGVRLQTTDTGEAYLRLGDDPKLVTAGDAADDDPPDAAWVDPDGATAAGLELSAPLPAGRHAGLRVHAKVPDDSADGYETLDLDPRFQDLDVACAGADPVATVRPDPGLDPPPADPGSEGTAVDPAGLAATGAPDAALLAVTGVALLVVGFGLRSRRRAHTRRS